MPNNAFKTLDMALAAYLTMKGYLVHTDVGFIRTVSGFALIANVLLTDELCWIARNHKNQRQYQDMRSRLLFANLIKKVRGRKDFISFRLQTTIDIL